MQSRIKVVAQKADPEAVIVKERQGFATTVINMMEDGTERKYRISRTLKRDLLRKLEKLPVEAVTGLTIGAEDGHTIMELFAYNGV